MLLSSLLYQINPKNISSLVIRTSLFVRILCLELRRIDTVIGILPVTSSNAAASGIAFLKLERNCPTPELRLIADQLGLVAGMIAVTSPAGPPTALLAYMQVMQIEPAVAKIRIHIRVAFAYGFLRMAGKAEGVFGWVVGRGSVRRVIGEQQLAVIRAVRHVTGAATLVCHRAMFELCRLNLILQLVMTGET